MVPILRVHHACYTLSLGKNRTHNIREIGDSKNSRVANPRHKTSDSKNSRVASLHHKTSDSKNSRVASPHHKTNDSKNSRVASPHHKTSDSKNSRVANLTRKTINRYVHSKLFVFESPPDSSTQIETRGLLTWEHPPGPHYWPTRCY